MWYTRENRYDGADGATNLMKYSMLTSEPKCECVQPGARGLKTSVPVAHHVRRLPLLVGH